MPILAVCAERLRAEWAPHRHLLYFRASPGPSPEQLIAVIARQNAKDPVGYREGAFRAALSRRYRMEALVRPLDTGAAPALTLRQILEYYPCPS